MDYRVLGSSGLKVSPIWLGVLLFGTQTDEAEAGRIVGSARAADINCIDTADVYGDGVSEQVTGQLIAADRANWILASKVGNPMGTDPNARGLSRRWIMRAVELSLQRLRTDWIDIYYFHRPDPHTPLEESVVAMADLVRMGKIRYFGLSNYRGWEVARVVKLGRPAVPIVLVTGWSDQMEPDEVRRRGIDFVVAKPFEARTIRRVVSQALATRQ